MKLSDFHFADACPECLGEGKYTGLFEVSTCRACFGRGHVPKGDGLSKEQFDERMAKRRRQDPLNLFK